MNEERRRATEPVRVDKVPKISLNPVQDTLVTIAAAVVTSAFSVSLPVFLAFAWL